MTHLLRETLILLKKYNIKPKKDLGQNFIINNNVVERIIEYVGVDRNDVILEIGAGLGTLTSKLAEHAKKVYAIEVDPKLCKVLNDRFSTAKNVEIICEDVLKMSFPSDFNKIVSNLPYSIATPVTFKILGASFRLAVLMYQLDVAKRLAAQPGTKDYGRLTVAVYYKAEVRILEKVSKTAFYPKPKVDSAIVLLKPKAKLLRVVNEEFFLHVVRDLFSYRNKMLKKALSHLFSRKRLKKEEVKRIIDILEKRNISPQKRIYTLSPAEFVDIANVIYSEVGEVFK
ncbi:MAG: 16S rRNA (adenine(1518)-N(6)/adenine(1519)-N(6))-dimethyltransferase RsmA [Candidatus Baldrarchaeia archaeon]